MKNTVHARTCITAVTIMMNIKNRTILNDIERFNGSIYILHG